MDIKRAMKGQYHAGLAMLRQTIEQCPDDLWLAGEHPRNTWRIAYHAVFYTHLYLQTSEEAFRPWDKHRPQIRILWDDPEIPTVEPPYSKEETLAYLDTVDAGVDGWVDAIDLESPDSGFSWYSIPKLDHQLLNLRHLQGHVGQLSELVMARGADLDWISVRAGTSA
jgi:hypothetical protein